MRASWVSSASIVAMFAVALFVVGSVLIRGFVTSYSVTAVLLLLALLGIAAIGQTLVIIVGGIDLSVPYVIGVANVVGGQLTGEGWPFWRTALLVAAIATGVGVANGYLSSRLRVHPLVITLGIGLAAQGAVLVWTHGQSTGSAPTWLTDAVSVSGRTGFLPVPAAVFIWLVLTGTMIVVLRYSIFGRQLYALGANSEAAELALVNRVRTWVNVFVISSLTSALVGVLLLGFTGNVDAEVGDPYLFQSIAAVVVGGTSVLGGKGGYERTVLGSLIIVELNTILVGLGLGAALLEAFLGVLIIVIVGLSGREPHIRTRI